ncbi:hypothetical protein I4U23_016691 [Adineta vaga]|nr:hypothetical protein I4U23_016691 [Adineta vaga]
MRKERDLEPFLVNSSKQRSFNEIPSQSWIRYLVGSVVSPSIFRLIVFFILLFIPITVLIIGINYRDPRHCPIEPRIRVFLIVHGSVLLGWILLLLIVSILTIRAATKNGPLNSTILVIVFSIIIILGTIFLIIWTIIGSVWTFNIYHWITYYYDTKTNFYPYNYCHPELYRFTFVYIILSYIIVFFQCCYHCFNNKFIISQN